MNKTHKTRKTRKTRKHILRKTGKHTMRKRKMYGGTVEELNILLKELVVDNKLHIPPLSEEQRIEFKNVKLPDTLTELNCIHRGLKELPKLKTKVANSSIHSGLAVKLVKRKITPITIHSNKSSN